MGIIANGQFLGGGFNAAPKASMSDGLFDLVILKDSGSLKMLEKLVNLKVTIVILKKIIFYITKYHKLPYFQKKEI